MGPLDPKKHRVALVAGQVASGLGNMAIEMGTLKAGNGFILPSGYVKIAIGKWPIYRWFTH
jgi:hypothetical protein